MIARISNVNSVQHKTNNNEWSSEKAAYMGDVVLSVATV